jgi:uncharacterized membrane protein YtjA (UPF0391 family)
VVAHDGCFRHDELSRKKSAWFAQAASGAGSEMHRHQIAAVPGVNRQGTFKFHGVRRKTPCCSDLICCRTRRDRPRTAKAARELFGLSAFLWPEALRAGSKASAIMRSCKICEETMLNLIVTLLIIALIAAVLGFGGIATAAVGIAKIIFFVVLLMFLIALIAGTMRGPRSV